MIEARHMLFSAVAFASLKQPASAGAFNRFCLRCASTCFNSGTSWSVSLASGVAAAATMTGAWPSTSALVGVHRRLLGRASAISGLSRR